MITAVIIKNVTLPPNISDQMSGKTLVISSQAEQKMNQQYDMQQVCLSCLDHFGSKPRPNGILFTRFL